MKLTRLLATVICAGFLGRSHAALGDLPLVNTIIGTGNYTLDFGSPGSNQRIAAFNVNSNDPQGFKVTFTFANLGKFQAGGLEVVITAIKLNGLTGTLGSGLAAPTNEVMTLDGGGSWIWTPGSSPTTETVNYLVEVKVDWGANANAMAGLYLENLNAVIVGGP